MLIYSTGNLARSQYPVGLDLTAFGLDLTTFGLDLGTDGDPSLLPNQYYSFPEPQYVGAFEETLNTHDGVMAENMAGPGLSLFAPNTLSPSVLQQAHCHASSPA